MAFQYCMQYLQYWCNSCDDDDAVVIIVDGGGGEIFI